MTQAQKLVELIEEYVAAKVFALDAHASSNAAMRCILAKQALTSFIQSSVYFPLGAK